MTRKRILIVDDNEQVRRMLCVLLEMEGFEAVSAGDGVDGSARLHRGRFDLVVTDLLMPAKEGIELIIELRKTLPELPILAISGGSSDISAQLMLRMAQSLGAVRTIMKPFQPEEFLAVVRELIHQV